MTAPPIKTSVLGMGLSATTFHIPFIQALPDLFVLHSIMERSATPTKSTARALYGDQIKVVTTLEEITGDPEVQCVVISTPNSTHYPYAKAILQSGKHVIIEKPLVPSLQEADELLSIASSSNPPLLIATYQNRRFDSDFLTVRNLIDQKVFGDIHEFESRYDRYRPSLKGGTWKETAGKGQGVLYDLGSHLIDQALTLFGIPDTVFATISNSRQLGPPDFADNFIAHLFYYNVPGSSIPLTVTVRSGSLSLLDPQLRFAIRGTKASFVKYGLDPQEDQRKKNPPTPLTDPSFGIESEEYQGTLSSLDLEGKVVKRKIATETGRYLTWYENVGVAIQSRDPSKLPVKPNQAREVIRIIELLERSSIEGRVLSSKSET
ncbi:hypothetical protein FRC02_010391 [Tulasnella sp. 418]|nr:hypothetical protein FRC02_010391 [Tulasnella sp. 418]